MTKTFIGDSMTACEIDLPNIPEIRETRIGESTTTLQIQSANLTEMDQESIRYLSIRIIQSNMVRQCKRAHSVAKRFIESIFARIGLVESHLSIAPREGIDFFAKRDKDLLPSPVEIRIDQAVQVTWETRKNKCQRHDGHRLVPLNSVFLGRRVGRLNR
jgi:hypothetical protein